MRTLPRSGWLSFWNIKFMHVFTMHLYMHFSQTSQAKEPPPFLKSLAIIARPPTPSCPNLYTLHPPPASHPHPKKTAQFIESRRNIRRGKHREGENEPPCHPPGDWLFCVYSTICKYMRLEEEMLDVPVLLSGAFDPPCHMHSLVFNSGLMSFVWLILIKLSHPNHSRFIVQIY